MWLLCHGDDFVSTARAAGQKHVADTLRSAYEVKIQQAGPGNSLPDEIRILGRVIGFDERGVTMEGDPAHVEQLME